MRGPLRWWLHGGGWVRIGNREYSWLGALVVAAVVAAAVIGDAR